MIAAQAWVSEHAGLYPEAARLSLEYLEISDILQNNFGYSSFALEKWWDLILLGARKFPQKMRVDLYDLLSKLIESIIPRSSSREIEILDQF